ncbi:MAG: TRCF domain-containing protein, partial [Halieaceae bacterium]
MIDRFGLLPEQVGHLFQLARLRTRAQQLGIRGIEVGAQSGNIDFKETTRVSPMSLVTLVQSDPLAYRLTGATRLRFDQELPEPIERQQFIEDLLNTFEADATEDAA